ncbi:MAG: phosphoglycerate kinase [Candidatus Paceibacterota bacterium]|jgi:phosphoglycerate kinase
MNFKNLKSAGDLSGKKVIIRLDVNVPIVNGNIRDDFRLRKALPTLEHLKSAGAKTLIIGHIESSETDSLQAIFDYFNSKLPVKFATDLTQAADLMAGLKTGEFVLLENLRRFKGEKENSQSFAKEIAGLGEIYINEAFSVSHRPHASIVGLPKLLPSFAGLVFEAEFSNLSKAFNPPKPFLLILGGAKVETKLPLIKKLLPKADTVFVGGVPANDFFKAKGFEVGASAVSQIKLDANLLAETKIMLPLDVVIDGGGGKCTIAPEELGKKDEILDAGLETVAELNFLASKSKFVLWNGPLGNYERGFVEGTENLARALAECGAETIVGGGDTLAALEKLNLFDKFSFVSTAGGAMLDFLSSGTLPGIEALENSLEV